MNKTNPGELSLLSRVRCFVLDMDGTFYLEDRPIEGALDFYEAARASGRRVLFLTNNSSKDGRHYVDKLNRMGCPVTQDDVYTSGMATCQMLRREYPGVPVYLLGNESLRGEFERYGIRLCDREPGLVVVGFDTTLDYRKLCAVCDFVRAGLPYIATHPDLNCPTATGFVPDAGAILAFIEASTGRRPDRIVGKPHADIVRGMLEMTGMPPDALCICGDRLYTDIATGVNNGILSVCVLSGETTRKDLAASAVQPDLVFTRLGDMIEYL
jgi:HAD superfamily hydrolase (TIGR01450 family)